jgi:hypothetical protein
MARDDGDKRVVRCRPLLGVYPVPAGDFVIQERVTTSILLFLGGRGKEEGQIPSALPTV